MRVAVIGLKGHQNYVMEAFRDLPELKLAAVCDDDPARIDAFIKERAGGAQVDHYTDWKHLLEHALFDLAICCDENGRHADQIIALAQRQIHIVIEKPLAIRPEDLPRIRAALAGSRSRLTMLLTMRHEACCVKMRELVRAGAVGEVCLATTQKSYRLRQRAQWFKERDRLGGIIPYIGIHAVDLIRWTTGLDFVRVAAFQNVMGKPEMGATESQASLLLQLTNGASATARLDYLRPDAAPSHGDDRLRIAGSEGVVEYRAPGEFVTLITKTKAPHQIPVGQTDHLLVDFVRSLKSGAPPRITTEDALYATEVVLRARAAAEQGRVLQLPPRTG